MPQRKPCVHRGEENADLHKHFSYVMPCRWAVMNFAPGGDTYFTCCVNSSVHVAM